jgi:protein O-GlcNAc transferase
MSSVKPGRNDPCPCGSGKKYKQCCLRAESSAAAASTASATAEAAADQTPVPVLFDSALAHHQAGRLPEAEALYRAILARQPAHGDALHLLGVMAYQTGQHAVAVPMILDALRANPSQPVYYSNLGNAQKALGEFAAARSSYLQALALKPDYAEAHNNLGTLLQAQGELEAALESYRSAIRYKADYVEALNNQGHALSGLGQFDAALALHREALRVKPDAAESFNYLGNALWGRGEISAARDSYSQALAVNPADAQVHNNLGCVYQEMKAFDAAAASFRHAIALRPAYVEAYANLGYTLAHQGQLDEALNCSRVALELDPDCVAAHDNLLFHLNYHVASSPAQYLDNARRYGARVAARAQAYTAWPIDASYRDGQPLRIGLVSGDLRSHPVGYFLESVLSHLDPQCFELFAYVTHPAQDALTDRLKPRFTAWRSLLGLSDAAAARLIHHDGVQILIDLAGHTGGNRLPVFAYKPAPVQVAWLGYFASTGVAAIDYILADNQVLPLSENHHFVETPWRLPDCYLCFTPPREQIAVGPLPALTAAGLTFACFNRLSKMNPEVVALWARVLHAVPGSRLLLKAQELNDSATQAATHARFAEHGIAPQRVLLEGFTPRANYLADYQRVDIALDPFPFPGGTTTVEALWMGVPVLSRCGDRFLAHAGESLLRTAGLADWVAADDHDYVAKAQAFAADLPQLARVRAGLRQQLLVSPLCDAPRFAAHLGAAFSGMWQQHRLQAGRQTDNGDTPRTPVSGTHPDTELQDE